MARPGLGNHPKFLRLVHLLKEPIPHIRGYLELMWEVAYECGNPIIGDAIDVELAAKYPGDSGRLCEALLKCRFLDELEDGHFQIHDLFGNAPDYVRRRMLREAERQGAGKNLSDIRREAGKKGIEAKRRQANDGHLLANDGHLLANDGHLLANDGHLLTSVQQTTANGATPAPAPAPAPNTFCSEVETTTEQIILTFPTVGKGANEWHLLKSKLEEYQRSFPGVDVMAECRKARQWCIDKPKRRKTPKGMPAFLTGWLGRTQNSPNKNWEQAPRPAVKLSSAEIAEKNKRTMDNLEDSSI